MPYSLDGWKEPTLWENVKRAGVSRRDFLKFCGGLAAIFATRQAVPGLLPSASADEASPEPAAPTAEDVASALGSQTKPSVVWLQLQECTGCMESALRSGGTTVEDVVLNLLSVDYNELLMAAAGDAADKVLERLNNEPHILVVNGSVPTKDNGIYCTIGGKSSEQILIDSAKNATAVLAVGACAVWGSVQASNPNPTGAVGVDSIIKDKPVVNVSGCPPIGEVILATISYLLTYGSVPEADSEGRPLFGYGQRIHDSCPRRPHFDAGQFVRTFDDEASRTGWCLYDVGCKGPSTFAPCPIIQWNMHTNWPIGAGHPCIGCTEKDFFDRFTPFYHVLPDVNPPGFPVELTAGRIGLGLVGATAAGVAIHAGATAIRTAAAKKAEESPESPLAAFGDSGAVPVTIDGVRADGELRPLSGETPAVDTAVATASVVDTQEADAPGSIASSEGKVE
ncbi:MAG: hydrogenase small subunit [Cellulomonadaceae bacterium]|jgi:hydrogenase small subunit|nr:hydrogenase small subunit [Cellulomonadaceae bacterium]